MAEARFYWLKLRDSFYNDFNIRYLRSLPEGGSLVVIYLELLCISLKEDGIIKFNGRVGSMEKELSLMTGEDVNTLKMALAALENLGLLIRGDETMDFKMVQLPEIIWTGSDSAATIRKRRQREREALDCNNVTHRSRVSHDDVLSESLASHDDVPMVSQAVTKGHVEIDKEIEKDKETDTDKEKEVTEETTKDPVRKTSGPYGRFRNVFLSVGEYEELERIYPHSYRRKIEDLSEYLAKTGKEYRSHYRTLRNWLRKSEKLNDGFEDYNVQDGESY